MGQGEEEEVVPVGRRLLIWAGASSFHMGDCATNRTVLPAGPSPMTLGVLAPLLAGTPPSRPHVLCQYPIPTGSWTIFKAYTVIRKNDGGWQTQDKSQSHQQNLSYKFPKKAVTSVAELLFHHTPLPWLCRPYSWCSLHFCSK